MGLAASTVITHQRSIYAKLGVHSRAELLSALQPA
jgi:DNA-binding CsgD family transcriptional regulator